MRKLRTSADPVDQPISALHGRLADEPERDCPLCPRLVAFRAANRAAHADWYNGAVPGFGPRSAPVLIVGLAPGLAGANRTGRPFTGDYAGVLLYETLLAAGFAVGSYAARIDDGLRLTRCRIVNAVRCVPPGNKPLPKEIATCNRFLAVEFAAMPALKAVLALGRIAHEAVLRARGVPPRKAPFQHGAEHRLGNNLILFDSYHVSRYNTSTGRLTAAMFSEVVARLAAVLEA